MSAGAAWQPIETAPKDGTQVLIHCSWEPLTVVGSYHSFKYDEDDDSEEKWRVHWDGQPIEYGYEATHWMPLPEPPDAPTA